MLPLIDDIDGTPMKTTYKVVFGTGNGNGVGSVGSSGKCVEAKSGGEKK